MNPFVRLFIVGKTGTIKIYAMHSVESRVEENQVIEAACEFWLSDDSHKHSPFPEYIRGKLKPKAINHFSNWIESLPPEEEERIDNKIMTTKFEEILFATATSLIISEDEKITTMYPFLPKVGDGVKDNGREGIVSDRYVFRENDHKFLKLKLEALYDDETWETSFKLPL